MPSSSLAESLARIVGPAHVLTGPACAPYVTDGRTPAAVARPGSREQAAQVVAAAAAAGVPVIPWGGGTAMGLGAPPPDGALVVTTARLTRIVEHEPGDLTATVEAGLTIEALQAALGARGQWWPLDPPGPRAATLGGVLATGAAGPRRHLYGTARDLVLGLTVVAPDGTVTRAGGRVVKNVAGYDLVKLHLGALGTLGLIVEASLKLRPRPETEGAVLATFADYRTAGRAAATLLGSGLDPSAVELLAGPPVATARDLARLRLADAPAGLLAAVDGLEASVTWQVGQAASLLQQAGAAGVGRVATEAVGPTLAAVADPRAGLAAARAAVRVSVLPATVAAYLAEAEDTLGAAGLGLAAAAHAGQGVIRLVLTPRGPEPDGRALARALAALRQAAQAAGGHLLVEWAPLAVRSEVSVWDQVGPAAALMRAIKTRLDPAGVMNPGRFVDGL